jgi:hypothetical protein
MDAKKFVSNTESNPRRRWAMVRSIDKTVLICYTDTGERVITPKNLIAVQGAEPGDFISFLPEPPRAAKTPTLAPAKWFGSKPKLIAKVCLPPKFENPEHAEELAWEPSDAERFFERGHEVTRVGGAEPRPARDAEPIAH